MSVASIVKGTVPFGDFKTWYRISGDPGSPLPALVVVHGGPGSTHDYLRGMEVFAAVGWPVVLYDQLGNGGSTHLPDKGEDFWTPQLFLDELDNLLHRLGVADNYVLFGQSWGGLLVARHAAARPAGLRGLVIANAPASYPLWLREMAVLRAQLPPGVNEVLLRHEAAGTTDSEEYHEAMRVFYEKHVCRLKPWPRDYQASFYEITNDPTVYRTMNGPSEFHVIGTLRDWGVEDCLPDIEVPTLVLSGRYDEATPETVRPYAELIPDARWEIFEESSHLPHLEEPERFIATMIEYLRGLPR
ncbi:proline iminopeptidase-family hydrolase [Streptomyces sp. NBC_00557]|uniref:proline iminopeptidase-family hydrolase n=1 Tax=Streptomyces sp. NBC_00557 TaxID=2975776 RepID=UPI002E806BEC|nr:proline iminopeptidase-family hydrolase [Streptomyces sp. NBC_00557]WUC40208.1 proline iminopeptidase-family hydrolase [Streptomyces sp. NBC_00557]